MQEQTLPENSATFFAIFGRARRCVTTHESDDTGVVNKVSEAHTSGEASAEEEDEEYTVKRGEMMVLGVTHRNRAGRVSLELCGKRWDRARTPPSTLLLPRTLHISCCMCAMFRHKIQIEHTIQQKCKHAATKAKKS